MSNFDWLLMALLLGLLALLALLFLGSGA